ncbi:VOC family protein [Adhaeribacter pallidiroseus]|uniref:Catechol 2,3-dioxygenase n=1 Tax=Adhaeribacter pallidiroseus TaxID=2072847 RepID=A0A369QFN1_9BACT|nr:VOC family protein [Adhaeribacter pallidiroseus]RDC62036.1 Catechol 2,3-dioxygenase [Adhaeribacter pallidiroseus]
MDSFELPDSTSIAQVTLRTHRLPALTLFYEQVIGLQLIRQEADTVCFSATGQEPALLVLEQDLAAPRQSAQQPGLFHVAYLLPSRLELARWWQHFQKSNWPLQGLGDHRLSEAIYLADPDQNGIEIYADRPRTTWPILNGQVQMTTEPVDVESLLRELPVPDQSWTGLPTGTRIGHIHLQVSRLNLARGFYHHLLGFTVMQESYPGALFVAAGGYHHHIGLNTWRSRETRPRNPQATGLASFQIQVPDRPTLNQLTTRLQEAGYAVEHVAENTVQITDSDGIVVKLMATV